MRKLTPRTKRTIAGFVFSVSLGGYAVAPSVAKPYILVVICPELVLCVRAMFPGTMEWAKRQVRNLDHAVNDKLLNPRWESTDLVAWLTRGRFDTNVSCHEKVSHDGAVCKRSACRFDVVRRSKMPKCLWDAIGRRRRWQITGVTLRDYLTFGQVSFCVRGQLLGWNAFGIALLVKEKPWRQRTPSQEDTLPTLLDAHLELFPRTIRLAVRAREVKEPHDLIEPGHVVVYGQYEGGGIDPSDAKPRKNGWISAPLCSLLCNERGMSSRTFTKNVPIESGATEKDDPC